MDLIQIELNQGTSESGIQQNQDPWTRINFLESNRNQNLRDPSQNQYTRSGINVPRTRMELIPVYRYQKHGQRQKTSENYHFAQ